MQHKLYLPLAFTAGAGQPRLPLADGHGPAQAGRDPRAGERGDGRDREPDRRGAPGDRKGWGSASSRCRTTSSTRDTIRGLWFLLAGVELRAADRVRQRRQPAARARGACGSGRWRCARRSARRRGASSRSSSPRAWCWRCLAGVRASPWRWAHARDRWRDAGLHAAFRGRRAAEHPRARRSRSRRRSLAACSSAARPPGRPRAWTSNETLKEGGRSAAERPPAAAAARWWWSSSRLALALLAGAASRSTA